MQLWFYIILGLFFFVILINSEGFKQKNNLELISVSLVLIISSGILIFISEAIEFLSYFWIGLSYILFFYGLFIVFFALIRSKVKS